MSSGPGPIDYYAIAHHEHERWREIRQHSSELDDRAATTVDEQARDILGTLGPAKLARIAAYRADRWASLAGTTRFDKNRDYYRAKSEAWQRIRAELDRNGTGA